MSAQPDKWAYDMRQDNDPVPDARTAEEREIIKMLERGKGREMTEQEINLSLEQARALGEL